METGSSNWMRQGKVSYLAVIYSASSQREDSHHTTRVVQRPQNSPSAGQLGGDRAKDWLVLSCSPRVYADRIDDTINVISPDFDDKSDQSEPLTISLKHPRSYIIHHPDLLLTMTSIANAMPCPRRPLLQALVKPPSPSSKPVIFGNILHNLLQGALSESDFSFDATRRRVEQDLQKEERKLEIWGSSLGLEDVRVEVMQRAGKSFQSFGEKWIGADPSVSLRKDIHFAYISVTANCTLQLAMQPAF